MLSVSIKHTSQKGTFIYVGRSKQRFPVSLPCTMQIYLDCFYALDRASVLTLLAEVYGEKTTWVYSLTQVY